MRKYPPIVRAREEKYASPSHPLHQQQFQLLTICTLPIGLVLKLIFYINYIL